MILFFSMFERHINSYRVISGFAAIHFLQLCYYIMDWVKSLRQKSVGKPISRRTSVNKFSQCSTPRRRSQATSEKERPENVRKVVSKRRPSFRTKENVFSPRRDSPTVLSPIHTRVRNSRLGISPRPSLNVRRGTPMRLKVSVANNRKLNLPPKRLNSKPSDEQSLRSKIPIVERLHSDIQPLEQELPFPDINIILGESTLSSNACAIKNTDSLNFTSETYSNVPLFKLTYARYPGYFFQSTTESDNRKLRRQWSQPGKVSVVTEIGSMVTSMRPSCKSNFSDSDNSENSYNVTMVREDEMHFPSWVQWNVSSTNSVFLGDYKSCADPKTVLKNALCVGNVSAVLALKITDPSFLAGQEGECALLAACEEGQTALAVALMSASADANTPTARSLHRDAWTPLHAAVYSGSAACVGELLRAGVHVDEPSTGGLTPLHLGAIHDRGDCVLLLLQAGADPFKSDHQGKSPASYAVQFCSRRFFHAVNYFAANQIDEGGP